ncbi:cation:proton antiporter [Gloeocapsopsis sp. IPPAS B-1203]|uniref:cation:proton antiporter n=1 Tax=Gloeocapsopsis sp. IPPAS B-1203 TaxID=2049454 RepID=UPI000C17E833|nr:cation:proton antiporter [Gloeocapsopsis sp. IPPAS B-1203]PIG91409.1 cation:proton antiporter [Gloeocapsopsis sp. IPPAS B-1203]
MNTLTIAWIALSLFMGFVIYLLPKVDRYLALSVAGVSLAYALQVFVQQSPLTLQLLDNFGVTLVVDQLSGYFILTNALVTAAVIIYCWHDKTAFFYMQTIILHGSLNAVFICADFMSLYVALEVIGIAAFLLIAYPRTERSIWVALRYLFVSNTAMLFYLVGAILVYKANHSFAFAGLSEAPTEAVALIVLGLLTKGGVFISGLWLPLTHSESETPVSALLSGIVVKAGVFPLLRCALLVDDVYAIARIFGVAAALFGVFYAILEKDTKRTLALSTLSQLGWILASPEAGGLYALAHGTAKSTLFLIAGNLPSRNFQELQQHRAINPVLWIALTIAGLSISGFPLFVGFGAKILTLSYLPNAYATAMNIGAVGTAIVYAKFIFLPRGGQEKIRFGLVLGISLTISALLLANIAYYQAYTIANIAKVLAIIAIGWMAYLLILRRAELKLPRMLEQFEHLIGGMSLMLILLFWMVFA